MKLAAIFRCIATALRPFGLLAFTLFLMVSSGVAQAQHTSTECPAQTATVASGGSVSIDVTDCAFNIGFAGIGVIDGGSFGPADFESHGTAVLRITGVQWFLDYSHNGSTGVGGTDVFEFADGSFFGDGDVQVTITITPSASPITVGPSALPTLTVGTPFSQTLTSTGGTGPYTYTLQSGALPIGVLLSSTGVLSGTPTQRGAYSFSVRSTDSGGVFVDRGYTGTVQSPSLSTTPASANAFQGSAFSQAVSVIGGVAPYSFSIETGGSYGVLPSGITMSPSGVFSGTTNAPIGPYTVTVRVGDASTGSGTYFELETFTVNVLGANAAPTANAGPDQTVASAAAVTLTGLASTDPESQPLTYTWSQTGGPAVTLSSLTAAQPTFTAPTVAFNASAAVLTFQLVVRDGVQNSAADTVQITVNPGANQAPTANAGPDQTVASAAGVTLTGLASTDPEAQPLTYTWSQMSGPAVTLSSLTAARPTFAAPTQPFNAADIVLTFSLTVNDGVQDSAADTVTITVTAPVDLVSPTVVLSGLPPSVLPGEAVTVTITFSEPVTGLANGEISISGGAITSLSGSGSLYTASITASGAGTLSVSVPAGVAEDVAGNLNLASNVLQANSDVSSETQKTIATFLQSRSNSLVSSQPGLIKLLSRGGDPQISVSRGALSFSITPGTNIWATVTSQWGKNGDTDTVYVLGSIGAHVWLNEATIVGGLLQFDRAKQETAGTKVEGTGWLVGPYIAGRFEGQPLFYEGRLLWGRTENEITQFGLAPDDFSSERFLASFKLQGELALGEAVLTPLIDASLVREHQFSYVDGLGNTIGDQTMRQAQIELGADISQQFAMNGGVLEPTFGLSAIYTETSGAGTASLVVPTFENWRSSIRAGVSFERGLSRFEATTFYDGLLVKDYRDYGLSLSFSTNF